MSARKTQSTAYLVESVPKGLEDLRGTPGVQYTEDVLVRLTQAARSTIDVTAMYWSLLPDLSGEEKGFTEAEVNAMGADTGRALLDALTEAAARGVKIRILESPGFSAGTPESAKLRAAYPDQVTVFSINMGDWYGGAGIMHQKIWIFDRRHLYLGSANMDWKSIMQVKEMGVAVEDCPAIAKDATRYFDGWCEFSGLPAKSVAVFDDAVRVTRRVPPWSDLVPADQRARSPLAGKAHTTAYNRETPLSVTFHGAAGGEAGGAFLSGCPPEVRGAGRTYDGDALVYTIDDAQRSVCVSVMDFAPVGLYGRKDPGPVKVDGEVVPALPTDTPVWWPALFSALLQAVLTRKVHVRLLVSKWAHTSGLVEPYLRALQQAADAGRGDKYMTAAQLEIKLFVMPGWDSTEGARRKYPSHTRVNHTKYIVTDRRINIGTSNMTWDYFSSTAGSSFNADHSGLVRTLQAVFDRDWASSYAYRLT